MLWLFSSKKKSSPKSLLTVTVSSLRKQLVNAYHTDVKVLMEINGLTNPDKIYAGQTLLVPFIG